MRSQSLSNKYYCCLCCARRIQKIKKNQIKLAVVAPEGFVSKLQTKSLLKLLHSLSLSLSFSTIAQANNTFHESIKLLIHTIDTIKTSSNRSNHFERRTAAALNLMINWKWKMIIISLFHVQHINCYYLWLIGKLMEIVIWKSEKSSKRVWKKFNQRQTEPTFNSLSARWEYEHEPDSANAFALPFKLS